MKAAIYARMSTDKQNEASPADQVAACRRYAASHGWEVPEVCVVAEAGISGASRHNRPGLLGLIERIAEWEVLLCWDSSRLARNQEDLGWICNRLRSNRRTGFEVSSGLELLNLGARVLGILGEEYLVKLRADTHRGMRGRVERGLSAGGLPLGYRSEKLEPEGSGSRIVVVPDQAAAVRRVFELYAAGSGIKAIAHRLNAEGVEPPRPRAEARAAWSPTAVREMLRNELYRGVFIWNRSEWIKNHETGRRRRFERPESEWLRHEDPDWRIVPEELWSEVRERMGRRRALSQRYAGNRPAARVPRAERGGRPRHMLAGFLRCEDCGGAFHALGTAGRFGCSWRRNRGASECANGLLVPAADLEARVLGAIREQVLAPAVVAYTVERAAELIEERAGNRTQRAAQLERLAELGREAGRLVELAARVDGVDEVAERLAALKRERAQLEAQLAQGSIRVDLERLRPEIERRVLDLRGSLERDLGAARDVLGSLLRGDRLRVGPDADRGYRVTGKAWLPLYLGEKEKSRPAVSSGRLFRSVAGGRFAPVREPDLRLVA